MPTQKYKPDRTDGIKLEFGKYYVVALAWNEFNPIHLAIMTSCRKHTGGMSATFMSSGYEGETQGDLEDLPYFRVLGPIELLNKPFRNQWKTPSQMGSSKYRRILNVQDEEA